MLKNILFIVILFGSIPVFSQKEWEKGNNVINQPQYLKGANGVKNIITYKIQNNDTIKVGEEVFSKNGDRLLFWRKNNDYIIKYEYAYINEQLSKIINVNKYEEYIYLENKVIKKKIWEFNEDTLEYNYLYNYLGNIEKLIIKGKNYHNEVNFHYDSNNLLISKESNGDIYARFEYDNKGNLLKELGTNGILYKSYKYDDKCNLIEFNIHNEPYELIAKRVYEYDEKNHIIKQTEYSGKKIFKILNYKNLRNGILVEVFYKKQKKNPDELYIDKYEYW